MKNLTDNYQDDLTKLAEKTKRQIDTDLVDENLGELIWIKEYEEINEPLSSKSSNITDITNTRYIWPAQYAIYAGDNKEKILTQQASDDNKYGQHIQVLFITLAGAEGLSLKNIRMVNIMEPFWNMVKINQVIGRARRNFSHTGLPLEQRNVRIYEYIGLFTQDQLSGNWINDVKYDRSSLIFL